MALAAKGTQRTDLRLSAGALRLAGKLKVGQRVTVTVTGVRTNGKKITVKVRLRAKT